MLLLLQAFSLLILRYTLKTAKQPKCMTKAGYWKPHRQATKLNSVKTTLSSVKELESYCWVSIDAKTSDTM